MKIIIEYDNSKLKKTSDELYNLFYDNKYNVLLLNNSLSNENKNNIIKNDNNYLLISNKLSNDNSMEIIYPLKDNDNLAKKIYDKLIDITSVSKYYQLRSSGQTNLDFYEIFRYIKNNPAIIIKYDNTSLNNSNVPLFIYQVINDYLGNQNVYIVKSGDSLYAIAKKYNTTVDELKIINNLNSNLLSIGQKLIIPDNSSNDDNTNTYVVKSGDSLYAIAKKYNTTVDELKRINNLTSNLLSIGQTLILPNNESIITYTVTKGDSLYSIARKYNTTVDQIKKDNILSSNLLSIGQKIIIKK